MHKMQAITTESTEEDFTAYTELLHSLHKCGFTSSTYFADFAGLLALLLLYLSDRNNYSNQKGDSTFSPRNGQRRFTAGNCILFWCMRVKYVLHGCSIHCASISNTTRQAYLLPHSYPKAPWSLNQNVVKLYKEGQVP